MPYMHKYCFQFYTSISIFHTKHSEIYERPLIPLFQYMLRAKPEVGAAIEGHYTFTAYIM